MAKARILIVEDEAIIASVIAGALRKFGYEVIDILNTGEAAVAGALQKKPDLILMDIRLQGPMDGISAVEQIQKQADIPVIYLTAYADEPTLERAKKTRPYGYIPKPFQEIELKTTIEMAIYKHGFAQQLQESEAKFRSLFENSQDVIYIIDRAGLLQEMNLAGIKLFGYSREELIGNSPEILYANPLERQAFLNEIHKNKSMRDHEIQLKKRNGDAILGLVTANVMIDPNGEVSGIQGIIRDVTEKKKQEETLLLLQTAIDSSSEAVLITDRKSKIVYGNPAVETLTGYSPPEIIGRDIRFLGGGGPQDEQVHTMWDTIQAGLSWAGEFINRRKDGTIYNQRAIISPVRDEKGEISHFVSIASDITREKKLEEQMLQAAKLDSLGQLASGIAHDFNNYLTIINGYSEMLLDENGAGKDSENLKIILQAGKNASKLVAKILGFSRRQPPAPVVLDINATLSDLERMVRRLVGERIQLSLELAPDAGCVFIDPGQIEQLLINLVINARDAMPDGGKLSLASAAVTLNDDQAAEHTGLQAGHYAAIQVRDSGTGIEPQVMARIFEPFFTTKPSGEGTGLGLASVFGIVHQNQGAIWVESELGHGSTFHLLLPQTTSAPTKPSERHAKHRFHGRTVLLVEDEQSIRQLLHAILESLGLEVREAADGIQGIKVAEEMPRLDLLFTDVVLPGLSGIKVAERVRELHPKAAVILSSGQGEDYLRRAGLDLKTMHFIAKPSSRKIIEEKIAAVLG